MNKHNKTFLVAPLVLLMACAGESLPEDAPITDDPAMEQEASSAALLIEKAERLLERGGDAAEAKRLLLQALAEPAVSHQERADATLALSRAHEALGNKDAAVALIEKELIAHADDDWDKRPFRERLRELLTGKAEHERLEPYRRDPAPAFARLLGKYFPGGDDGRVQVRIILFGGDQSASNELGTWNVAEGRRATFEQRCPLCEYDAHVHTSRSQSDWTMIPETKSELDDALVVFYYDLDHNRIPARYESLLPMSVAELDAELKAGKALSLAKERPGSPPVILLAAPREALLADVERDLSQRESLPTEARYVEVGSKLKPREIQRVVRSGWFPSIRGCYESMLERVPDASGKINAEFVIARDGSVSSSHLSSDDRVLQDDSALLKCLSTTLDKLRFPSTAEETTVNYPVVVTPD